MPNNSDDFGYLRHQLLTTSTDTAHNIKMKRSTTHVTDDKKLQNQVMQPIDNNELTTRKRLIIHRRHEKRLANNHRHIHELWGQTFHQTEIINTVLIIGTYLNHNLKRELMANSIKHIPFAKGAT